VSSVILGIVAANQASKAVKLSASSSGLAALNWLLDSCVVILLLPEVIAQFRVCLQLCHLEARAGWEAHGYWAFSDVGDGIMQRGRISTFIKYQSPIFFFLCLLLS